MTKRVRNETQDAYYLRGWVSAADGRTRATCPCENGSNEYKAWMKGFDDYQGGN